MKGTAVSQNAQSDGQPAGDLFDWYHRAVRLHSGGNPEAAAQLLMHAHREEPASASLLEALARALFDARRYAEAAERFAELAELSPDDDYARFGLGLTRMRLGKPAAALEHLAMAVTMRPDRAEYAQALREARATLRSREQPS